jgi:hypothetical protein
MSDVLTLEAAQVAEASPGIVPMSPWVIQSIVYELLTRFFQAQPPESLGYPLKLKYDPDKAKSDIYVNIAYNYDASLANKRPSIFISRGDCEIAGKTMGHQVPGGSVAESTSAQLLMSSVRINLAVISAPIAQAELLADYAKQAFIGFQQQIQHDFGFRRFRLTEVSRPQIYVEAKEYFVVNLSIEVVYDEGRIIRRDDLKLKSVGMALFDALTDTRVN